MLAPTATGADPDPTQPLPTQIRLEIREKELAIQRLTAQMLEAQIILERGNALLPALREALQKAVEAASKDYKCQKITDALACVSGDAPAPSGTPPAK
jgi:hypothetical protein